QHDLGHAIAAIAIAAANAGLRATLLPEWPHADIAALTGIDRDADYVEAEREEPGCLIAISRQSLVVSRQSLINTARGGTWTGQASQLSGDTPTWTFICDMPA